MKNWIVTGNYALAKTEGNGDGEGTNYLGPCEGVFECSNPEGIKQKKRLDCHGLRRLVLAKTEVAGKN
jgi:hypothetical protein